MPTSVVRSVFPALALVIALVVGSGCSASVASSPDFVSSGFHTIRDDSRNETIPATSKLEDAPRARTTFRSGNGGKARELARRF